MNLMPSDKSVTIPDMPSPTCRLECLYPINISLLADSKNDKPLIKNSTVMPLLVYLVYKATPITGPRRADNVLRDAKEELARVSLSCSTN